MLQISNHDETFLILNDAMTRICHSRKRDRIYLKKLSYLRNFLGLLQLYRVYIAWKFRKKKNNALEWPQRKQIEWKQHVTVIWQPEFYRRGVHSTEVIFRFHNCQLTVTRVDNASNLFLFDIKMAKDKKIRICLGRQRVKEILSVVCECEEDFGNIYCLNLGRNTINCKNNIDE